MAIVGVEVEEGLEEEAGGGTAIGGSPELAGGLEAGAVLFVEEGGVKVGDETAEDLVTAEGADAFDLFDREGVAVGADMHVNKQRRWGVCRGTLARFLGQPLLVCKIQPLRLVPISATDCNHTHLVSFLVTCVRRCQAIVTHGMAGFCSRSSLVDVSAGRRTLAGLRLCR